MTDRDELAQRIQGMLRRHRFMPGDLADGCMGCSWEGVFRDAHEKHVAEQIVAALPEPDPHVHVARAVIHAITSDPGSASTPTER